VASHRRLVQAGAPSCVAVRSLGPVFRNLSLASLAEVACALHRKMNSLFTAHYVYHSTWEMLFLLFSDIALVPWPPDIIFQ
jgi:hypothetical protein